MALKRICDICNSKTVEGNHHYRVMQEKLIPFCDVLGIFSESQWQDIDICDDCYKAFIGVIQANRIREEIRKK